MAIIKKAQTAAGVDVEYWKISGVVCSEINNQIEVAVELSVFINKASRDAKKLPVLQTKINLGPLKQIEESPQVDEHFFAKCYRALKNAPEFADSADV